MALVQHGDPRHRRLVLINRLSGRRGVYLSVTLIPFDLHCAIESVCTVAIIDRRGRQTGEITTWKLGNCEPLRRLRRNGSRRSHV